METATGPAKALFWEPLPHGKIRCDLCPHHCTIAQGKHGICLVKENRRGELVNTAYGRTTSFNFDPIEKKPLYHFHPGSTILSVGPNACNLACDFCQNYAVSQTQTVTRYLGPKTLAARAGEHGSIGVAYTYSEPLMWYEYLLDAGQAVHDAGFVNVLVTNGHLEEAPLRRLLPFIDALNIDVKSMDEPFYKKTCKGKLSPVLRAVEVSAESAHVEITNLVIPGLNDSDDNFERLADFIASVNPLIPLHLSAFHPDYKMLDRPVTPVTTLLRGRDIARQKLAYVYIGNVRLPRGDNNTHCHNCNSLLIDRDYAGVAVGVKDGICLACGQKVNIIN